MDTHETSIYTAILTVAMMLGCIIFYFAFSVIMQHRRHLNRQNRQLLNEMQLIEKERLRVARDLHDELGTLLVLTKSHIEQVQAQDEKETYHLGMATSRLQQVMKRMGEIAINLSPAALEKKGLHYVLQDFFEEVEEASGIKIFLDYQITEKLDQEKALQIFRMAQEITNNTIKHSRCSIFRVEMRRRRKHILLLFKDDGIGYDAGRSREGLGTESLRSRASMLGGKLFFHSAPEQGTQYLIILPVAQLVYDQNSDS